MALPVHNLDASLEAAVPNTFAATTSKDLSLHNEVGVVRDLRFIEKKTIDIISRKIKRPRELSCG